MTINSGFSHEKPWFSIAFCMFTRGYPLESVLMRRCYPQGIPCCFQLVIPRRSWSKRWSRLNTCPTAWWDAGPIGIYIYYVNIITKGSVSYLSSSVLQHKLRGYWGASPRNSWNSRRYVLDINYKGGGPPPENGHGFNSHGWRGHGPPH